MTCSRLQRVKSRSNILDKKQPDRFKTYRENQKKKGFSRIEFQAYTEAKERFEAAAMAIADQYNHPFDLRCRLKKAKTELFSQLTQGVTQEFYQLKEQIQALRNEVKALSPSFFKSDQDGQIPLPEAISTLPDDPAVLKQVLARTYQDCQQAKKKLLNTDEWLRRYQALHEAAESYNERLKTRLSKYEEEPPTLDQ